MKVICAWCRRTLEDGPEADTDVSHGICPDCARTVLDGGTKSLPEFLRSVGIPVMVLDGDFKVVDMNGMAESALHTTSAEAQGSSVGAAISCLNAGLPGGCGASEHCPGCQLRRFLMATYTDGQPRFSQITQHQVVDNGVLRPVQLRFSTEKVGGVVVLLLENKAETRKAS